MSTPRPLGSRYELLDLLGTGAMGEVWRARDREGGRELAAKVLRAEYARDAEIVTRFIQERSILMNLRHPNIVRVHDLVVEGDRLGILMDLVEGGDLRVRLKTHGPLGRRDAVTATCAVLDALADAHANGCLHRDVKPDNVLLAGPIGEPGSVRLSDFSIARLAQESTVMATGLLGTPGYMPPELFTLGTFSAASDVYAAGVLLYELLSGRTPFAGSGTAHTIGHRHVTAEPPRIPVEDELWDLVATMLDKDPKARLSATATAAALRALPDEVLDQPSLPVQPHPETWETVDATVVRPTPQHAGPAAPLPLPVAGATGSGPDGVLTSPNVTLTDRGAGAGSSRRGLAWLVGSLALIVAVGGGVAVAQSLGTTEDTPTPGVVTRDDVTADPTATGLGITREATYDAGLDQVELTLRYSAQDAPLTGPFLQVIPPASDTDQCPGVTWQGVDQPADLQRSTRVPAACAFGVDVGPVPAQSSVEVTATVDVDLGDDPEAVSDWLAEAVSATDEALASDEVTSGAYAVQRLADVRVDVEPGLTTASRNIEVALVPVWIDGTSDPTQPLFNSVTTLDSPTETLVQVAGGLSGVRLLDACDGALSILGDRQVSTLREVSGCQIAARVGTLEVRSDPFDVSGLGG